MRSAPLVPRAPPPPPSPTLDTYAAGALGQSSHSWAHEPDRGRKPSFRRKVAQAVRARTPDLGLAGYDLAVPGVPGSFVSPPKQKGRTRSGSGSAQTHARVETREVALPRTPLYRCAVVHACAPPPGVSYRALPFFTLRAGARLDVLREEGHPSAHRSLPLYVRCRSHAKGGGEADNVQVDDGDDCLLLVRDERGELGWALASFLVPLDG
jgi:hypothetical protein